jgi:hypothetical protein
LSWKHLFKNKIFFETLYFQKGLNKKFKKNMSQQQSNQQLTPNAANIVAGYFTLTTEEQSSVFGIISKTFQYSPSPPPHAVFSTPHPFPLFSPISPQPVPSPHSMNVWKTQDTTNTNNNFGELREVREEEEGEKNKTKGEVREKKRPNHHNTQKAEYALEPISDYCIQVCEKEDGCACRYKATAREQRNDFVPAFNLNGLYVFNLRRDQGYIYLTERAGLKQRNDDERIRVFGKKGVAYITLESHEQAVEAYKNLRMNGVKVNWQKERNQKREEEGNSSGESVETQ